MATNSRNGDLVSVKKLLELTGDAHLAAKTQLTEADQVRLAILDTLGKLGGLTVGDDALTFDGSKFVLPETYEGRVDDAIEYLQRYQRDMEDHYQFSRTFNYRPNDGANAFHSVLMKQWGTSGMGKAIRHFFGTQPPMFQTINVSATQTVQVPWGRVEFPPLEATFDLGVVKHKELGNLFALSVDAPKRYRKHIDAFFQLVEEELRNFSIYKGKAITGAADPGFLDVSRLDPKTVVYSDAVITQLDANLWSLLRYTREMRKLKMPLKRAVLLEGPYGTGKTLAGMLTAQIAERHGWTYILCRTGQDNLHDVLKTAQLYAPAVVWFEDIDTVAGGGDEQQISTVLDLLDGITSKGTEVVAAFTTNFVEKIHKGVLRPGRLDAIVHIGGLDQSGFTKLINNVVPPEALGEIDFAAVTEAFDGFLPAFAVEAAHRAIRYSMARNGGKPDKLNTADLVAAAEGLRPQLDLMNGASNVPNATSIDSLLSERIAEVLNHTELRSEATDRLWVNEDLEPVSD